MNDDYVMFTVPIGLLLFILFIFGTYFCISKGIKNDQNNINNMTSDQQVEYKHGIKKIEYENHSYLIMSESRYLNGICHDENCKCRSK